ncbi:MAG: hypothetical protein ABIJ96_02555 [Elusimicrobiota bacterium]
MRILLRMVVGAALLLPSGAGAASAAVVAAAAKAVRPGAVMPIPGAALRVPAAGIMNKTMASPLLGAGVLPSLPGVRVDGVKLDQASVLPSVKMLPAPLTLKAAGSVLPAPLKDKKAAAGVRGRLRAAEKGVAKSVKTGAFQAARSKLGELFDGLKGRGANAVSGTADFRPPNGPEDRRINRALARLADSPVGLDLYTYVYQNYNLEIMVDDDRNASYDARLDRGSGRDILYLTRSLVNNESKEVVAAYIAREMSDLYFETFPESAERGYMAYSNMVRVFAELTDSGLARYGHWWDTGKDQRVDGAYAMERYYGSWKEAVHDYYYAGRSIQRSPFFGFLKQSDDSNAGSASHRSLSERYRRGEITYRRYYEMKDYFKRMVDSETEWIGDTGRW